ncbi:MAG: DUF2844 domain-containing protein [Betaproteobacteria bacterium]
MHLVLCACVLVGAGGAWAALGQAPTPGALVSTSAKQGAPAQGGSKDSAGLFTVYSVQLETGTVVQEYVNASGTVFAVAWRGPVLPDLGELLGAYFTSFKAQAELQRASGSRQAVLGVDADGLVVRSGGRMRNFFGSAYATGLVPAGLRIQDVLP